MCTKPAALNLQEAWGNYETNDDLYVIGAAKSNDSGDVTTAVLKEFYDLHNLSYPLSPLSELGGYWELFKKQFVAISRNNIYVENRENDPSAAELSEMIDNAVQIMNGGIYVASPIHSFFLEESEYNFDLSSIFDSGDSENVTYSIVSNSNVDVALAEVNDNILKVYIDGKNIFGFTDITVNAEQFGKNSINHTFTVINPKDYVYENFESIISDNWEMSGNADWVSDGTIKPFIGDYCFKSDDIINDEEANVSYSAYSEENGLISFAYKVSSESGYDFFSFYIDEEVILEVSGEIPWTYVSYEFPAGEHILKWQYKKDYIVDGGEDCAWIDAVILPEIKVGIENPLASKFKLENHPNPFNPKTNISLTVDSNVEKIRIEIFNVLGQKVKTLFNGKLNEGTHSFIWNGKNDAGENLASGVYFYKASSNKKTVTNKMLMIK